MLRGVTVLVPWADGADQPWWPWRAASSSRSAVRERLSAAFVIWVATSRAREACRGVRIKRRSSTSESKTVVEKYRPTPTSRYLTAADQNG